MCENVFGDESRRRRGRDVGDPAETSRGRDVGYPAETCRGDGRRVRENASEGSVPQVATATQRRGYGKRLFDGMLAAERREARNFAYDRPSPKMLPFLRKYVAARTCL